MMIMNVRQEKVNIKVHAKKNTAEEFGAKQTLLMTSTRRNTSPPPPPWEGRVGKAIKERPQMNFEMKGVQYVDPGDT